MWVKGGLARLWVKCGMKDVGARKGMYVQLLLEQDKVGSVYGCSCGVIARGPCVVGVG